MFDLKIERFRSEIGEKPKTLFLIVQFPESGFEMGGKQQPSWFSPTLNLHFLLELLPSPLKLRTLISESKPTPNPIVPLATLPQSQPRKAILGEFFAAMTRSLQSILPRRPPPVRRCRRADAGCAVPLFRPYVAKVPWHGGARAFLSQLFPRYGHYCGPNWSSGKDGGSLLWDQRPIDWLDFCCYCHDIGYDTYDQAKLLKADLTFLECLEKPRLATEGDAYAGVLYRAMCIAGLRTILIPYRTHLVKLQSGPSFVEAFGNFISKLQLPGKMETVNQKERL